MCFGYDAPDYYYSIPESERNKRCELTSDLCSVGNEHFYIRGRLEIPVIGGNEPFAWLVWSSLSQKNFSLAQKDWNRRGRENEPPAMGWFSNSLRCYPDTLNLKVKVWTRPVGQRPFFELEPTDHPLAVEQRNGISIGRVKEIAEQMLHQD